ncbi:MAG: squalene--hopene cyclase [Actinomycetota bacterium]|jgi:squalene-hopene/tetraprenyl-beta-curcumene cyclase|nr:squalene--hopene cyclase [Actinomycetota bacterium]
MTARDRRDAASWQGGDAATTLKSAIEALVALQHESGWWKGELETNVTMDAEDLLLRQFLGIRTEEDTAGAARWIRTNQREDGTWANYLGGPGDLSTTIEAYVALRLAGDPPDAPHMSAASAFVRERGGLERARVFTKMWLALFGKWPWDGIPVLPPELMFFPSWLPLNIYDFGCWARQTVVALTIVSTYRPVRDLGIDIEELRTGLPPLPPHPLFTWEGALERGDVLARRYARRPVRALREAALREAERWIVERQEADGGWGGIQPPWVYSIIALHLRGYALTHPVLAAALRGLQGFIIRDERGRRLEACQSPVWDTALGVIALADAGLAPDDPVLTTATRWLVGEEVTVDGDWKVRRPRLSPGGWAFEFANDHYPDIDDTAEVVLSLLRSSEDDHGAIARATDWVLGMQCRDGGWAAFDVDNTRALCRKLPFCDFGELIDPPSADVTAHVVEMLAALEAAGRRSDRVALERGVAWLLEHQEPDGSWFGRWGANYVYGTGAVLPALVAAGVPTSHPAVRRAVEWLCARQNDDGGWGEDLRSYDDPSWAGRGASTASQTAWALLALLAAGEADRSSTRRGVEFLCTTQRPDGTWDEPWFTGTGFPGDFYINYHLYRLVFPITALGRFVHGGGPHE